MSVYTADKFVAHLQQRGVTTHIVARPDDAYTIVRAVSDRAMVSAYFNRRTGRFTGSVLHHTTIRSPRRRSRSLMGTVRMLSLPTPTPTAAR